MGHESRTHEWGTRLVSDATRLSRRRPRGLSVVGNNFVQRKVQRTVFPVTLSKELVHGTVSTDSERTFSGSFLCKSCQSSPFDVPLGPLDAVVKAPQRGGLAVAPEEKKKGLGEKIPGNFPKGPASTETEGVSSSSHSARCAHPRCRFASASVGLCVRWNLDQDSASPNVVASAGTRGTQGLPQSCSDFGRAANDEYAHCVGLSKTTPKRETHTKPPFKKTPVVRATRARPTRGLRNFKRTFQRNVPLRTPERGGR